MRTLILAVAVCGLMGCAFGQGFKDGLAQGGAQILADSVSDALDRKLVDDFAGLGQAVRDLPGKMPVTPKEEDKGLLYSLGVFAALLGANGVKGVIRGKMGKAA